MRLPQFDYVEAGSLNEAATALAADPHGAVLAGGTDLLVNMKYRVIQPSRVINLKTIRGLAYIRDEKAGIRIGSLTTLHDIASSFLQERLPVLAQAAGEVGAYAHQVMGTLGGNLCQGNRCRYFNQSISWRSVRPLCYKAGGEVCHVVRKPEECHSTYCGDMAPVLIALDSQAKVAGPRGERTFPLRDLYARNGKRPLSLGQGEILAEVFVPSPSGKTVYRKWRLRGSLEFPIVSLALHVEKKEGQVDHARIVFSGIGPGPVEADEAEKQIKGAALTDQSIGEISREAVKAVSPMRTSVYSPSYKRKMAAVLLEQALRETERTWNETDH